MPSIWSYSDFANRGFGLFKRKLFEALRQEGWITHLAEATLTDPESKPMLRDHLFRHPTDWILLINQSAGQLYDYLEIPTPNRPLPQKKIVWYLDDPQFFVTHPFEKEEYLFLFDETYVDFLSQRHSGFCGFLPLAADMNQAGQFNPQFTCEVSFVGGVIDQSERRIQLSEEMQEYVDRLIKHKLNNREKSFHELALEFPISPGKQISITPQVAHYLYWETNNRYRIQVLESLQEFDLHIYGNEDWEILLQNSPLRAKFKGRADPMNELPDIFASSAININIHSVQCRGSLNQRDFNAPIAGGFLLSDWVPAAGKYFDPGKEAIYWSDTNDLYAKINYYLMHPEERMEAVEQARRRVMKEHTYQDRVKQLIRL